MFEYYTVPFAANILGIPEEELMKLLEEGDVRGFRLRIDGQDEMMVLKVEDIEYLKNNKQ